jgi:DNA (cytosine-5)-methyltransferase 1
LPPFPKPTHGPSGSRLKRLTSIYDALIDIIAGPVNIDDDYHQPQDMRTINKDAYNPKIRMLSGCITTGGGENYHFSGTRQFTARELALCQSFPLDYAFTGTQTDAKKQIGNAFPPCMAQAMFESCAKTLEAFDHGHIEAEDDLGDLDQLVHAQGIRLPQNPLEPQPLFQNDSLSSTPYSKYRYLSTPTSVSRLRNQEMFSTPNEKSVFARNSDIISPSNAPEKPKKTVSFFQDLTRSDKDEDGDHNKDEEENNEWRLTKEESLWLAREYNTVIALD